MNKNLLLWVIIIVVVTLTYLGMFFLGRNSVKAPVGTVEIKEHYVHDTTYAKPKPPIIIHDTTYATRTETTFTDSTSKSEQGASVKVKHTISEIDKNLEKYPSYWKIDFIPPPERIIKEYITKDSVRTIVESKFFQAPWFMNTFFYTTVGVSILFLISLIFR